MAHLKLDDFRLNGLFVPWFVTAVVFLLAPYSVSLAEGESRFKIVTTTAMLSTSIEALLSEEVCQESVEISSLMGSAVDPHLYKPTRSDLRRMSQADLMVVNGLLLEGKFTETFKRLKRSGRKIIEAGDLVDESKLLHPSSFEGHPDPHIWMDPVLWIEVVNRVKVELEGELPAKCAIKLDSALADYVQVLRRLDRYAAQAIKAIPAKRRVLVTAHDAFGYFAKRYGMKQRGIQGISTESEAGVSEIEELVSFIVERQVPSVFVESTVSDRNVSALVEGCRSKGFKVKIGGRLFSDGMGLPGTYRGTYVGMLDHNITAIAAALGGGGIPGGFQGKLK